ncbi:MAG: hypothetical protein K2X27_08650 [Candidatus Obscuribacterales bacterium]|nr:hypothetical protein [Candidatus Obscuribacterales bacterium]
MQKIQKSSIQILSSAFALLALGGGAFAQGGNDFFGSSVPSSGSGGGPGSVDRPPGVIAAEQQALKATGGDYTADEKRMQKKFKANLKAAEDLIGKAERMVKDGEKKKDDKMVKKGKVLKEVAEKRVQELKENSPLPDK